MGSKAPEPNPNPGRPHPVVSPPPPRKRHCNQIEPSGRRDHIALSGIGRYWINQPSTLQSDHAHHGLNVLADIKTTDKYGLLDVYPTSGSILSLRIFAVSLSPGWTN